MIIIGIILIEELKEEEEIP